MLDYAFHHFGANIAGSKLKDPECVIGQGISFLEAARLMTGLHEDG
jgi:hypothetical protein